MSDADSYNINLSENLYNNSEISITFYYDYNIYSDEFSILLSISSFCSIYF